MNTKNKVIAVVGPTASGKTNIAIELAKLLNGEVVSADSRLVYKDFNIGTAKPCTEEMQGIPHHMIDIENPLNTYTASKYKTQAGIAIKEIHKKNKLPIITGGTGFYIKTLLEGLNIPEVEPDEEFRAKMEKLAEEKGAPFLHSLLMELDPSTAEKLYTNDAFRIIRAMEVHKVTGKKMSELQTATPPDYEILYVGLNSEDRSYLYDRINLRVTKMMEAGLLEEVENLIEKYGKTVSLLKTLGYKEICEYLDNQISKDEAVEKIQKNTRNFAKRQLTWFRANKNIHWFYIDKNSPNTIINKIIKLI